METARMAAPWRSSLADRLFEEFAAATRSFHEAVVAPACDRLEAGAQPADRGLNMPDYLQAVAAREARKALALGLAALWESHFREHLWKAAAIFGKEVGVTPAQVEKAQVPGLESAFAALRGFPLHDVPGYRRIEALIEVANAARHGNGRSSNRAFERYPEYFTDRRPHAGYYSYFLHGGTQRNDVRNLDVTAKHLADFAEQIEAFWGGLRRIAATESGADENPAS